MKKPFKETGFGKFLSKVASKVPDIAEVAISAAINPIGGMEAVLSKLKEKESNNQAALQARIELEREFMNWEREQLQIQQQDRDSARSMQKEALKQSDTFAKRYVYYLASFIVISAFFFGVALLFVEIPKENKRLVEMFADVFLFGGAITVIQFFFSGSFSTDRTKKPKA